MCANNSHQLLKYLFWYLLVLFVNWSVKHLEFAPKWSISCFQHILVAISVTIATDKVKLIQDFYTLVIVLINQQEQISYKKKNDFYILAS